MVQQRFEIPSSSCLWETNELECFCFWVRIDNCEAVQGVVRARLSMDYVVCSSGLNLNVAEHA